MNTNKSRLTNKEEEVMEYIWTLGPCSPKDIAQAYPDPKPHVNTVATSCQALERKGYLTHEQQGRGYLYIPAVEKADYGRSKLANFINNYFGNSYKSVVSAFMQDERLSAEELDEILSDFKKHKSE